MKVSELQPGIYKIRKKEYAPPRRGKGNGNTAHLLRVQGHGEKQKYFIDHDSFGAHPRDMSDLDQYEVVSKYDQVPQVMRPRITILWVDGSGDEYTWQVTNAWSLRGIFDAMPWIKDAFGYVAKRRK